MSLTADVSQIICEDLTFFYRMDSLQRQILEKGTIIDTLQRTLNETKVICKAIMITTYCKSRSYLNTASKAAIGTEDIELACKI